MTRFVSSTNENTADDAFVRLVTLVDLNFPSGHVRVHDGIGTLAFGGNTYLGVGKYGGIEGKIEDAFEVIARPLRLSLSGLDSGLMSSAMTEAYQGRDVTLYVGFLNLTTNDFVATPEAVWEGRMDYMELDLNEKGGELLLNCEHRLRREPRIARYTDQDQQRRYSGDLFFELVPRIRGFVSKWGEVNQAFWGGSGGKKFFDFIKGGG